MIKKFSVQGRLITEHNQAYENQIVQDEPEYVGSMQSSDETVNIQNHISPMSINGKCR